MAKKKKKKKKKKKIDTVRQANFSVPKLELSAARTTYHSKNIFFNQLKDYGPGDVSQLLEPDAICYCIQKSRWVGPQSLTLKFKTCFVIIL